MLLNAKVKGQPHAKDVRVNRIFPEEGREID